jgi:hypothetical protein
MASAQADRGGVAAEASVSRAFSARIRAFADELLDFAEREHAHLPVQRSCELPDVSLDVGFSASGYAELCDRAYLPRLPAMRARKVRLSVLDHASLPGMPRWASPAPGLGYVMAALAEHGLRGECDTEYAIWYVYDPARALGVQAMQTTTLRPPWEPSFPLRLLLHWAGRTAQSGMVHAGTLGHQGTGVFLVGAGGSGKSGTTLSGILHGLTSVGDDYVAVRCADGRVEAEPVLRVMKQDIRGLRRLGLEAGRGALDGPLNWQGKAELDFARLVPGARAERLAMKAILLPRVSWSPSSSFRQASAREAMLAMAPSSLYQLYGSLREDFRLIASIVRAVPAFHLDLGEDPAEVAASVRAFIEQRVT